jgi:hypothetical protein
MVEFKLFPWFDENFSATARLDYPLFGIGPSMQMIFPGYIPRDNDSVKVFAATLEFSRPVDDVPEGVCIKLARGVDEVVRLTHEASVYRKGLAKLWGIAVPKMYGFFIGHHEDDPVACLLLELCLGPSVPPCNSDEFMCVPFFFLLFQPTGLIALLVVSRLAMQTVRKIHTLGVTQDLPLELHHFVMKDNKVMLVDFSRAVGHRCNSAMPLYSNQRFCLDREDVRNDDDGHDCSELIALGKESMRAASSVPSP